MNKQIVELYGDADVAHLAKRIKRWRAGLWTLAVAALTACIAMAALAGTENAARMELVTIIVSTSAGWIVIYCGVFVVTASRRELSHANMLRGEARQTVSGAVTVTGERVAIRRSITARRVEVRQDGQTRRLLVCESRAKALAAANAVTLYTAHGYVAAYEVTP